MLMAHVGMEFEDISIPGTEWPALKKKVGGGGMPIIEMPDGMMMQQTVSMAIYIGKYHGLQPTDPFERWINDSLI